MKKLDINQLSDLVRGVAEREAESAMKEHLAGSKRAQRQVELLQRVAEVARRDMELEIPAYALRVAKAAASVQRPQAEAAASPLASVLRYIPGSVAFDSLLEPSTAGVRDLQSSERQIVYKAQEFTVDVRVEREADSPNTVVVGQLLRSAETTAPVAEVPVLVLSQGRIVGRSLTSRFGEFQAEGLPAEPLNLCLLLDPEECIEVPLGNAPN